MTNQAELLLINAKPFMNGTTAITIAEIATVTQTIGEEIVMTLEVASIEKSIETSADGILGSRSSTSARRLALPPEWTTIVQMIKKECGIVQRQQNQILDPKQRYCVLYSIAFARLKNITAVQEGRNTRRRGDIVNLSAYLTGLENVPV